MGEKECVPHHQLSSEYGRYKTVNAGFWPWLSGSLGGVPREQKVLKGHLPRVEYHQVCQYMKIKRYMVFDLRS